MPSDTMRRILDDHYELLQSLGESDGVAWHYAWDHRGQRPVGVREISRAHLTATAAAGRFTGELAAIAALDHPGIMPLYALRRDRDGAAFIVYPFIDGLDLATMLDRLSRLEKSLPERLALHLYRQVISALDYAHRVGGGDSGHPLAHTALRPPWVLVGVQGAVKLTGFVETRLLADVSAPQAGSRPAADLAAAAWMLYEMLTGLASPLGDGRASHGAVAFLDAAGMAALKRVRCSSAVRQLLGTALSPQTALRYPSAASILEDVRRLFPAAGQEPMRSDLAVVVQGLLTDEEAESRRRMATLRGSRSATTRGVAVETSNVLEALDWSVSIDDESRSDEPIDETADVGKARPDRREGASRTAQLEALLAAGDPMPSEGHPPRRARTRRVLSYALPLVVLAAIIGIVSVWWQGVRPPDRESPPQTETPPVYEQVLQTIPTGALVFINDSVVGSTPLEYSDFDPGPLRLRFEYPGFSPVETVLVVRTEGPVPEFPPFVFRGTVTFSSVPPGARPIVNGRPLRDFEALAYEVAASETLSVGFDLNGERSPSIALFNPTEGLIPPTDTALWRWHPESDQSPAEVVGVFARTVQLRSEPAGALIFVDGDSVPVGQTNTSLDLPYGEHTVLLQKQPFLDYRFSLTVAGETPSVYAPVLKRTVRLGAVDAADRAVDLKASVDWIRRVGQYIRTPEDGLSTPYSLQLDGREHEIHFSREGYADTTVTLPGAASSVKVALRRLARGERPRDGAGLGSEVRWVRFIVQEDGRRNAAGAEVIGIEKTTGDTVRYGPTDVSGLVVVPVPIGDYEWQAVKDGFVGRTDGERIKPGDKTERLTLRLDPR
ncbi:MAG TPA: PEGA domain-containing protein [Acidobacteriota bacterium]|nr:PEGA domain-containing protein [Acidobacteriota bacterium]